VRRICRFGNCTRPPYDIDNAIDLMQAGESVGRMMSYDCAQTVDLIH